MGIIDEKTNKLILSTQEYENLANGELIEYESFYGEKISIYKNFIRHLIRDESFFNYFKMVLKKGNGTITISSTFNDRLWQTVTINAADVIQLLSDIEDFTKEEKQRVNVIKTYYSFEQYFERMKQKNIKYWIYIDYDEIEIEVEKLLRIFTLKEDEFMKVLNQDKIFGIDKYKFMYMLDSYFIQHNLTRRYVLSDELKKRYMKIREYEYLDFQSINYFGHSRIFKYNVEIHPQLKKTILENIDDKYTPLEKSIYIYIKLCKLFSYDPVYYASGQNGEIALLHQNLRRIQTLKSSNDLIVCYEFNAIYSKLLDELNIEYSTNSNNIGQRYGKGHANLVFCKDKYIVQADAVTSILSGDLINAKLNKPLQGLSCVNKSNKTKEEFDRIKDKVYSDIICDELATVRKKSHDLEYIKQCVSDENIRQKLSWIIKLVDDSRLKEVDSLGYMLKLKNEFFTKEERKDKISFAVVRTTIKKEKGLAVIITIKNNDKNRYFYYVPNKQFMPIPNIILKQLINRHVIEYIEGSRASIPGFENKAIKK